LVIKRIGKNNHIARPILIKADCQTGSGAALWKITKLKSAQEREREEDKTERKESDGGGKGREKGVK